MGTNKNCANEISNPEPDHFPGLNSWEACTQQATAQAHSLSFAIGFGLGHAPLNLPKTNMTPKEKGFVSKMSFLLFCGRFVEGVYPIHLNKMPAKYGGLSGEFTIYKPKWKHFARAAGPCGVYILLLADGLFFCGACSISCWFRTEKGNGCGPACSVAMWREAISKALHIQSNFKLNLATNKQRNICCPPKSKARKGFIVAIQSVETHV